MKHKIVSSLALAAAMTALATLTAFAAEAPAEARTAAVITESCRIDAEKGAGAQAPMAVTVIDESAKVPMRKLEFKTGKGGSQVFVSEDGETIYASLCEPARSAQGGDLVVLTPAG